jgi:hypothetical protein
MSALAFATRPFTPFVFRPRVERAVTAVLAISAGVLWLVVVPLELAIGIA